MSPAPAAIYARYSTDRQDARSIEDQTRRCRRFAEERGYEVVAEFRDAAKSGATMHRADMQRLLAEVQRGRKCPFRAVLVDDLSRLSRDLGDTWRLVFEDLASADVRVVDCTTGQSSDVAGARLTFGAMALVNDTFLQFVKAETHRSLDARARDGFWPGGPCYGYYTEKEPDVERPRSRLRIQPSEAAIVQRIFAEYADGMSLPRIAAGLNADAVEAPLDGYDKKTCGRGWSRSLLHFMLRNERYMGRMTWNKRQWFRDPVTKRRRCRVRPPSEWVRTEAPELALVDIATWERVQARHAARRGTGVRPIGVAKHEHMLSGMLRCGHCGSPMSIVSRTHRNGNSWSNYGCSARHQKGGDACSNSRNISERRIDEALLTELWAFCSGSGLERWVQAGVEAARGAHRPNGEDAELAGLQAQVRAQERQVKKAGDILFDVGLSDELKDRLRAEEEKLRAVRARLAGHAPRRPPTAARTVSVAQVMALLQDVAAVARKAPLKARALLANLIEPVVLVPQPNGYTAEVTLRNAPAALEGGRVCDGVGCGARI
jgi:site-specific DNA recombinase